MTITSNKPEIGEQTLASSISPRYFYSLNERLEHIEGTYDRLVLISDIRHFESYRRDVSEAVFEETLFVSSSWRLWQKFLSENKKCIHIESHFSDTALENWSDDIDLRANDWMYDGEDDQTFFQGVSLGRKFVKETRRVLIEVTRLGLSLEHFIKLYKPQEIYFYDFRTEGGTFNGDLQFDIVKKVGARLSVQILDYRDITESSSPYISRLKNSGNVKLDVSPVNGLKKKVMDAILSFQIFVSRINYLRKPRHTKILMLNTGVTGIPLLKNFHNSRVLPLYLSDWFPGKSDIPFFLGCLWKGVVLTKKQNVELTEEDRRELSAMKSRVLEMFGKSNCDFSTCLNDYIENQLTKTGRLESVALDVKRANAILDSEKPDQYFTDSQQNALATTFMELSKIRGVKTNQTWHGFFLHELKTESLGSDPRVPPLIDRVLTWGQAHEDWLDSIGAITEKSRIGNPVPIPNKSKPRSGHKSERVLVLQYAFPEIDFAWPQAGEYEYFISVIRMLNEMDFKDVRFKMHPGPYKESYFESITQDFGLKCTIDKDGSFSEHVEWADLVIGPAHSGALLEVLGYKKPYFAVLLPPHSANTNYLDGYPVYDNFGALKEHLLKGIRPDFSRVRNHLTGMDEIENPAQKAWQVLAMQPTD